MKKFVLHIIVIFLISIFGSINISKAQNIDLAFSMQMQNPDIHSAVIYPNPITDFKFSVKSEQVISKIEVINLIGKCIENYYNENYSSEDIFINLNTCDKGMYLVKITFDDDEYIIKKLLVK